MSSPFLLAALSYEMLHLAGSMSWLPARQLVTSFSLKLAWKSFHLCTTAAEHLVGHCTWRCCIKSCHGANGPTCKLSSELDTAASFGSLALHLSEQFRRQMTNKCRWWDPMASRNEVVMPSISARDCEGKWWYRSLPVPPRNYITGHQLSAIWASLWSICLCF